VAAEVAAVLLFVPGAPAWCRPPADDADPAVIAPRIAGYHGIVDERMVYYWNQGLMSPRRSLPQAGATSASLRQGGRQRPIVVTWGMIGRYGFEAGDLVHIVDAWLLDPLLMRLPAMHDPNWRIGHFTRRLPEGYLETLASGENRIHHPGLRRYYDALRTVISAPVFDEERLRTTGAMLRGEYDQDLAAFVAEEYHTPPRLPVAATELDQVVPTGTWWFDDPRVRLVYLGGLEITWPAPVTAHALRVLVSGDMDYVFRFRREGREVGQAVADARHLSYVMGLQELQVPVPREVGAFDTIWLDAHMGVEYTAAIGRLVPEP
jgi:arabinofuranosyltransferase